MGKYYFDDVLNFIMKTIVLQHICKSKYTLYIYDFSNLSLLEIQRTYDANSVALIVDGVSNVTNGVTISGLPTHVDTVVKIKYEIAYRMDLYSTTFGDWDNNTNIYVNGLENIFLMEEDIRIGLTTGGASTGEELAQHFDRVDLSISEIVDTVTYSDMEFVYPLIEGTDAFTVYGTQTNYIYSFEGDGTQYWTAGSEGASKIYAFKYATSKPVIIVDNAAHRNQKSAAGAITLPIAGFCSSGILGIFGI